MKRQVFIYLQQNRVVNKNAIRQAFYELNDGRYLLTIDSANKRTLPQNAYYHGCVVPLVRDGLRDVGYREIKTVEDAHEVLKSLFLKKNVANESTGEVIEITGSTAKLTTIEFNEFIDSIIQWASEFLNIQIPLPGEAITMFA